MTVITLPTALLRQPFLAAAPVGHLLHSSFLPLSDMLPQPVTIACTLQRRITHLVDFSRNPIKDLRKVLRRLRSGMSTVKNDDGRAPGGRGDPQMPLATRAPPTCIFKDTMPNWKTYKADICCITWRSIPPRATVLSIPATARSSTDIIRYPKPTGVLPPRCCGLFAGGILHRSFLRSIFPLPLVR